MTQGQELWIAAVIGAAPQNQYSPPNLSFPSVFVFCPLLHSLGTPTRFLQDQAMPDAVGFGG